MPSASAQQQKKHTKQRRKRRAIAAESSSSASPIQSSEGSSDDDADNLDTSSAPHNADLTSRVDEAALERSTSPESIAASDDRSNDHGTAGTLRKLKRSASSQEATPVKDAASTIDAPSQPATNTTKPKDLGAEFDAFYLRQLTLEFGNDLEKLRQAPDFKDSFVPVLVKALRQGSSLFSESEKKLVLGIGGGGSLQS